MNSGVTPALTTALTQALIFDMDGTIVDSMPHHALSWLAFGKKHKLKLSLDEMMQRTTGRNGLECVRVLLDEPDLDEATAWNMVHEKEMLYREIYGPYSKKSLVSNNLWR